jgi:hypothetical protein
MDINVAYRQLSTAMDALRAAVDSGSPEALVDAQHDLEDAINAWEGVDQWMRKSGFPPVAWPRPNLDGPRDAVLPPVPEHMRPIRGHDKLCRLLIFGEACDCSGIERTAELAATRERDSQTFFGSRGDRAPLCHQPVGDGSGSCGLPLGHGGGCEW